MADGDGNGLGCFFWVATPLILVGFVIGNLLWPDLPAGELGGRSVLIGTAIGILITILAVRWWLRN